LPATIDRSWPVVDNLGGVFFPFQFLDFLVGTALRVLQIARNDLDVRVERETSGNKLGFLRYFDRVPAKTENLCLLEQGLQARTELDWCGHGGLLVSIGTGVSK
jgi:hypothetical protein